MEQTAWIGYNAGFALMTLVLGIISEITTRDGRNPQKLRYWLVAFKYMNTPYALLQSGEKGRDTWEMNL